MSIDQRALVIPRMYPILRARTDYFNLQVGSSAIKLINVLSGSKPSCLVVQFVKQENFDGSYHKHIFQSNIEFSLRKLFVKLGSKRYPKNWEYA